MNPVSCKDCIREGITRQRAAPHPGPRCTTHHRQVVRQRKAVTHEQRVRTAYGLNPGEYQRLYEFQGGVCAGCRRATGRTKRLAVDHDHSTMEARGLLCGPCNRLVGHFRDDPSTFIRLADYLAHPPLRMLRLQESRSDQFRPMQIPSTIACLT